jgi:hypothetical protein
MQTEKVKPVRSSRQQQQPLWQQNRLMQTEKAKPTQVHQLAEPAQVKFKF